jgi:histidyl-tRNA synthetase
LQKVWRGERPQRGRYREFYQFDIDIVARETLPLACDAEVVTVIEKAYRRLNLCDYEIRLNNRKILIGFYSNLGLSEENSHKAIGIVDKIDKIGVDGVHHELKVDLALATDVIEQIIALSALRLPADSIDQLFNIINCNDDKFLAGISELNEVIRLLPQTTKNKVVIDGSLARGLGYYTGTILEVRLPAYPEFGSAGGGGRYDNLTARFTTQNLPAVGASIGISRLIALIIEKNLISPTKKSSAQLLVTVLNETDRPESNELADCFRSSGIPTEVFYKAPKLGKQIDYADQKGIRFVAFLEKEKGTIQLKDLTRNVQENFNSAEQASLWVKSCLAE